MFLSNGSIARPVAMSCLIIALTLLGASAYFDLGLELLPKMEIPYVTVTVEYPGASPSDVEADVAKRIEDAVASVDGLKHMLSSCYENMASIILEFVIGTDVDVAANDVRQKVDSIIDDFPATVKKPVILKVDINAIPIVKLALTGALPINELYDYADQELSDRLSSIPGVANVDLLGGAEKEIHVVLDRGKVSAAGLSSLNVVRAVESGVMTIPAGRIQDASDEYSVRYYSEYDDFRRIADLQVAGRDGARRYIRDLGRVEVASKEVRQASFINGRPCIGIQVVKRPDANAVKVVNEVKQRLAELSQHLPGGSELFWVTDDGEFIEATFDSTMSNIRDGIILTAIILFLFLFNARSTLVVAISMPLTIIITIFLMQLSGFTFNLITMVAMGLSVGTLVTNSIVVLESVAAQIESGADTWEAAKKGANDVAVAVMASAGTNMVVLLPIGLMGSLVGMIFSPFAMTTLYANLVSLFISFTLVPILCAVLLKVINDKSVLARIGKRFNATVDRVANGVSRVMRYLGRRRLLGAGLILAVLLWLVQSVSMFGQIGFAMFPDMDRSDVGVKLEFRTQQNLRTSISRIKEAESLLWELPGIKHMYTDIGKIKAAMGSPSEGTFLANVTIKLVDKTERKENIHQFMNLVNEKMAHFSDCIVTTSIPSMMGTESMPVTMAITGMDLNVLDNIAATVRNRVADDRRYVMPSTSVRAPRREIQVEPRRALLADAGIDSATLGTILRTNIDGYEAAQYKSGARSYDIRVKFAEEDGARQVEQFQIPLANGGSVMLPQYADISIRSAPIMIARYDKMRMSTLYSNLDPNFPLSNAIADINRIMDAEGILPPGYNTRFLDMAEMMDEAIHEFSRAIITAIVLTYLVLAASLESFTKPFYILLTIPCALIGMLWALRLTGYTVDSTVMLGGVLLIGIVVNAAVLIIDHTAQLIKEGMPPGEAMLSAITLEFRPIVMITLAAALGMLPLATASGLGSEMLTGIGSSSVGGVLVSGLLTLILIPVAFLMFNPPQSDEPPPMDEKVYEKVRRTSTRFIRRQES